MKKRVGNILLTLAMLLALSPAATVPAWAENWAGDPTTLGAGTYVLTGNTSIDSLTVSSGAWAAPVNAEINLNGNDLTVSGDITIGNYASLTIRDSSNGTKGRLTVAGGISG